MIDVYVLDENLSKIGIIDAYKSLIWANRYDEIGDCELYITASLENIAMLKIGNYLVRNDDEMVCQIKKIEIDTSAEDGNYLIVTGYDAKALLDQRIIWSIATCSGNVEDFIRGFVENSCCTPSMFSRQFQKKNGRQLLFLGEKVDFPEVTTEQVSYKGVGEKIREYCKTYNWGYKISFNGDNLIFQLYKGADRSGEVVFSDNYENLSSTKYVNDKTNLGNVAIIGGAGEGSERDMQIYGYANGLNRYEKFVDAKDISRQISWQDLTTIYPTTDNGGYGYLDGNSYKMEQLNVQIVDFQQRMWLQTNFPDGQTVVISGHNYYHVSDVTVATLETATPTDESPTTLQDIIYYVYLLNRGAEHVAEFGEKVTFEGSIIPDITFVYKKDFFLGDVVSIENEYGIRANTRIIEIVEVLDENGYKIEPKFEHMEVV